MRPELKKLNFEKIKDHLFAMSFKGGPPTWDIDKEGWMILAHQGGLTEYRTELHHFEKVLVRETIENEKTVNDKQIAQPTAPLIDADNITSKTTTEGTNYEKTTTSKVPVYAYMCVVSAHVVIGGVPGSRTISLRSDTLRRKKPIGQDNLVATADTSATKAAIKFALGITKDDVQSIAKELKLDSNTSTKVVIPEDVEDDEVTAAMSEEELKKIKDEEAALW
jgi:hypothetical protein